MVQSGATLAQLQALVVPHGWTLPVLPGTARVTVGGAVSSDVHAKNQPGAVTFGHHVRWLTLVRADGTSLRLAPDHRPEAFWATVGGMGLTGLIDLVCLRLHPIGSPLMVSSRRRTDDLAETLAVLEQRAQAQVGDPDEHAVAWVDASARARPVAPSSRAPGRSTPQPGAPTSRADQDSGYLVRAGASSRRSLPGPGLVGRTSIRAANRARWRLGARPTERVAGIGRTLHPLDRAGAWPAAFGSGGLVQYQFVVPPEASAVVGEALVVLQRADCPPALATLKRFTSTPTSLLAFAVPGWALALDFPARWSGLEDALATLDALVADSGGRVYLTKDGRLGPVAVQRMYPRLEHWRRERAVLDPRRPLGQRARCAHRARRRAGGRAMRLSPSTTAVLFGATSQIGTDVVRELVTPGPRSRLVLAGRPGPRRGGSGRGAAAGVRRERARLGRPRPRGPDRCDEAGGSASGAAGRPRGGRRGHPAVRRPRPGAALGRSRPARRLDRQRASRPRRCWSPPFSTWPRTAAAGWCCSPRRRRCGHGGSC